MGKSKGLQPDETVRRLLDALQTGVALCNVESQFLFANRIAEAILRRAGVEAEGRFCHSFLFGSDAPCEECPCTGASCGERHNSLALKGPEGDVYLKVFCRCWSGMRLITLHDVTQEITLLRRSDFDRKELLAKNILLERRRKQNQDEQQFLAQLMDNLPEALVTVDENFQIQRRNKAGGEMFPGSEQIAHCYAIFGHDRPCTGCPALQGFGAVGGQRKRQVLGERFYTELFSVSPGGRGGMLLFRDTTRQIGLIEQIRINQEEIDRKNAALSMLVEFGTYLQKEDDPAEVLEYFLDQVLPGLHEGGAAVIVNDSRAGNLWLTGQRGMSDEGLAELGRACLSREMQQEKSEALLDGVVVPWEDFGQIPLVGATGQRIGLVVLEGEPGIEELGMLQLVTEPLGAYFQNQLLLRQIEDRANRDAFTGLYNRGYLTRALEEEKEKHARYGIHYAVVVADVNRLKMVNDKYGHDSGDQLITAAADAIRDCLRSTDIAARTGGDEFVVLLTGTTDEEAGHFVERLQREAFAKLAITMPDGTRFPVRVSLGKAGSDRFGSDSLLREADQAMYAEKERFYETVERYR
ncbi:MAG: diguanylate cyclase [Thermodesulfobacteriota bacterium]